jgi:hypothetical protein
MLNLTRYQFILDLFYKLSYYLGLNALENSIRLAAWLNVCSRNDIEDLCVSVRIDTPDLLKLAINWRSKPGLICFLLAVSIYE